MTREFMRGGALRSARALAARTALARLEPVSDPTGTQRPVWWASLRTMIQLVA